MSARRPGRAEVRSAVEPRIVERRRTVEAAGRRRRLHRLLVAGAVLGLVAVAVGAVFSPVADLDRIVVTGSEQFDEDVVARISGLDHGAALVTVDLAAARDRLRAEPSIAAATVQREWPGTVRVSIVEERPVAAVPVDGAELAVAVSGRVLGEAVSVDGLPLVDLVGEEVPSSGGRLEERSQRVLAMLGDLRPELVDRLVGVRLDGSAELRLELDGGAVVRFGPLEDVPAKLLAIETVLDRVLGECLAELDVREPTRPAVGRSSGCAPPEPTESAVDEPSGAGDGTDPSPEDTSTGEPA